MDEHGRSLHKLMGDHDLFIILDDVGSHIRLNIWLRETLEEFLPFEPDLRVESPNIKRVILNLLQRFPAKVLPIESNTRGIWLFTAVEISKEEAEAIKTITRAKITLEDSKKMAEIPTAKEIVKHLALKRLLT